VSTSISSGPLGSYSVAIQQLVASPRALEDDTRVLVLDEPTASLTPTRRRCCSRIVRDLKSRGIAIVFITHFIDQVYQIADRICVAQTARLADPPRWEMRVGDSADDRSGLDGTELRLAPRDRRRTRR